MFKKNVTCNGTCDNELATTGENMIVLKKAYDLNTRFVRFPNKQPDCILLPNISRCKTANCKVVLFP